MWDAHFNPSSNENRIFRSNWVKVTAADALVGFQVTPPSPCWQTQILGFLKYIEHAVYGVVNN